MHPFHLAPDSKNKKESPGYKPTPSSHGAHLRAVLGVCGPLLLNAGLQQLEEVEAVQGVTACLRRRTESRRKKVRGKRETGGGEGGIDSISFVLKKTNTNNHADRDQNEQPDNQANRAHETITQP